MSKTVDSAFAAYFGISSALAAASGIAVLFILTFKTFFLEENYQLSVFIVVAALTVVFVVLAVIFLKIYRKHVLDAKSRKK